MKINLSILGATGSIGSSTFKIINKKRKLFEINLLSANKNFMRICNQIQKYKPKVYVITDKKIFISYDEAPVHVKKIVQKLYC